MKDKIREKCNIIYGSIFKINDSLLKQSSQTGSETVNDVIDFYITSHALSFLKNMCLGLECSAGNFLNMRCIVEGMAIKNMFISGEVKPFQTELFLLQHKIVKHCKYKKLKHMVELIGFDWQKIVQEYERAKSVFLKHCSEAEFKEIEQTEFPFLLDKTAIPIQLVKNYANDYLQLYRVCSQYIHPNDNKLLASLSEKYISYYFAIYEYLVMTYIKDSKSLARQSFCELQSQFENQEISTLTHEQTTKMQVLANEIEKTFSNNFTSNYLFSMQLLLDDIVSDAVMGLSEQVKIKWKIVLESFAVLNFLLSDFNGCELRSQLLACHTKYQFLKNTNYDKKEETIIKKAYQIYQKIMQNNNKAYTSRAKFKGLFSKTTGYTASENSFINLTMMCKNLLGRIELYKKGCSVKDMYELNYMEAQLFSHANAYLYFADAETFSDFGSIINGFDILLINCLNSFLDIYCAWQGVDENNSCHNILQKISELKDYTQQIALKRMEIFERCKVTLV